MRKGIDAAGRLLLSGALVAAHLAASACGDHGDPRAARLGGRSIAAWEQDIGAAAGERRAQVVDELTDALIEAGAPERFPSLVPVVAALLDDEDADVRFGAAQALGLGLERTALPAVERLARVAREDAEPFVREEAVTELARIAAPPRALAAAMFGAENLKPAPPDPDPARSAEAGAIALATVDAALDDEDGDVRDAAVSAIGRWGPHAVHLAPRVARFLRDPDPSTQHSAVMTARYIGAPAAEVIDGLIAILRQPAHGSGPRDIGPYLRRAAVLLVTDLGQDARAAVPALEALQRDPDIGEEATYALVVLTAPPR